MSEKKVNKSRIRRLVKALRSGKYNQTQGALRLSDGFCCLGVACDVYRKRGRWRAMDGLHRKMFLGAQNDLPLEAMRWFGFEQTNPVICEDRTTLASENDAGKSFNEIADLIEDNFL